MRIRTLLEATVNILLLLLLLNILYGVVQAWPKAKFIKETASNNLKITQLKSDNSNLSKKIEQAQNHGPIVDFKQRYYFGFIDKNETFYKVEDWA